MKAFFEKKNIFLVFWFCLVSLFFLVPLGINSTYGASNTYEDTDVPVILGRSVWENTPQLKNLLKLEVPRNLSDKEETPNYYLVSRIIIHDTACPIYLPDGSRNLNCNSYKQDPVSLIQDIYRYHVLTKGYRDIGYHFIVNWDGRIFEGLYGGNAVVGSHLYQEATCQNYNIGTIGILLLGNLESEKPSIEMYDSLKRLVGWLAVTNDLDPEDLSKTSLIWSNFSKIENNNKSCDLSKGIFKDYWKDAAVLYYKDIINRGEEYNLGMKDLRKEAAFLGTKFKKYLYKKPDQSIIWAIKGGTRQPETKIGLRVLELTENQLEYFPEMPDSREKIKDNELIRLRDRDQIFFLKDGVFHEVMSRLIFEAWKFKEENIKEVDSQELEDYSFGSVLSYPAGTLVREEGKKEVYLVNENETLSHITSLKLFGRLGFDWKKVLTISSREKSAFFEANPLFFSDGTLVKGPDKTIYFVSSGTRKPIRDPFIFQAYQFSWSNIIILSDAEIKLYPLSDPLDYPDGLLLSSSESDKIYLLKNGRRNLVSNQGLLANLKKTANILIVSPEELLFYPLGQELKTEQDIEDLNSLSKNLQGDFLRIGEIHKEKKEFTTVRVLLAEINADDELVISANKDYNILVNGGIKDKKSAESIIHVKLKDTKDPIRFASESGNTVFRFANLTSGRNNGGCSLQDFDTPSCLSLGARYRGSIEILPQKSDNASAVKYWLVNELFLEDYLRGLNPVKENNNPEFLKVLTITNRSYAFHYVENKGRYQDKPFDLEIQDGNIVYKGYDVERMFPQLLKAIEDTRGIILTYKGKAARAIYSLDTCGISRDARSVLGTFYQELPYLWGGVYDHPETTHEFNCPSLSDAGIGMSLAGVQKLIQIQKKYSDILRYYYPETLLDKLY